MWNFRLLKLSFNTGENADHRWRKIIHYLIGKGELAPGEYLHALGQGSGPRRWVYPLFVFFGAAQILAALVFFFAYNWNALPGLAKIALPQTILILGLVGWLVMPDKSRGATISGLIVTIMLGVSMGVIGQVYQLGADPWPLFVTWAVMALPLALVARSDAQFGVWFAIATTAWFLFGKTVLDNQYGWSMPSLYAIYGMGVFMLLMARELLANGPPAWLRWLLVAAGCLSLVAAGLDEIFYNDFVGNDFFGKGIIATTALWSFAGATLIVYGYVWPDRPARAIALFVLFIWGGALGLRFLFDNAPSQAGAYVAVFLSAAIWVIALTAGFAYAVRRLDQLSSKRKA